MQAYYNINDYNAQDYEGDEDDVVDLSTHKCQNTTIIGYGISMNGGGGTVRPNVVVFIRPYKTSTGVVQREILCFLHSELRELITTSAPKFVYNKYDENNRQCADEDLPLVSLPSGTIIECNYSMLLRYSTYLLYDPRELPVGSVFGVSTQHGAIETVYQVRPVHREYLTTGDIADPMIFKTSDCFAPGNAPLYPVHVEIDTANNTVTETEHTGDMNRAKITHIYYRDGRLSVGATSWDVVEIFLDRLIEYKINTYGSDAYYYNTRRTYSFKVKRGSIVGDMMIDCKVGDSEYTVTFARGNNLVKFYVAVEYNEQIVDAIERQDLNLIRSCRLFANPLAVNNYSHNLFLSTACEVGNIDIVGSILSLSGIDPSDNDNLCAEISADREDISIFKLIVNHPLFNPEAGDTSLLRYLIQQSHTLPFTSLIESTLLNNKLTDVSVDDNSALKFAIDNNLYMAVISLFDYPGVDIHSNNDILLDYILEYNSLASDTIFNIFRMLVATEKYDDLITNRDNIFLEKILTRGKYKHLRVYLIRAKLLEVVVDYASNDNAILRKLFARQDAAAGDEFSRVVITDISRMINLLVDGELIAVSALNNSLIRRSVQMRELENLDHYLTNPRREVSSQDNLWICVACDISWHDGVEMLLRDPQVDPSDLNNYCLRKVFSTGDVRILTLLLSDSRINLLAHSEYLKISIDSNTPQCLEYLIQSVPELDLTADDNYALTHATTHHQQDIIRLLLTEPLVDPSINSNALLIDRITAHDITTVTRILQDRRVDPSANSNDALFTALVSRETDIIRLLLRDRRVDPTIENNYLFIRAIRSSYHDLIDVLLQDERIDPTIDNNLALRTSVISNDARTVAMLLAIPQVDIGVDNNSIIMSAVVSGNEDIVVSLLDDSRLQLTSLNICSVLKSVISRGMIRGLASLLRNNNINLGVRDNFGIKFSISQDNAGALSAFLQSGRADVVVDNKLLEFALEKKASRTLVLLLRDSRIRVDADLLIWAIQQRNSASMISGLISDGSIDVSANDNAAFKQLVDDMSSVNSSSQQTVDIFKVLLAHPSSRPGIENNFLFKTSVINYYEELVSLLLADGRVDPSMDNNWAIKYSVDHDSYLLAQVLLEDHRVDPSVDNNYVLRSAIMSDNIPIGRILLGIQSVRDKIDNSIRAIAYKQCGKTQVYDLIDILETIRTVR